MYIFNKIFKSGPSTMLSTSHADPLHMHYCFNNISCSVFALMFVINPTHDFPKKYPTRYSIPKSYYYYYYYFFLKMKSPNQTNSEPICISYSFCSSYLRVILEKLIWRSTFFSHNMNDYFYYTKKIWTVGSTLKAASKLPTYSLFKSWQSWP